MEINVLTEHRYSDENVASQCIQIVTIKLKFFDIFFTQNKMLKIVAIKISFQFNNLGKTYKVGTVLPQETGNCLQCVCTEGSNTEGPRVTCSPHNCPPLILPDLFDATGY